QIVDAALCPASHVGPIRRVGKSNLHCCRSAALLHFGGVLAAVRHHSCSHSGSLFTRPRNTIFCHTPSCSAPSPNRVTSSTWSHPATINMLAKVFAFGSHQVAPRALYS